MKKFNQIIPLVIIVCCVAFKAQAQFGDLLKKVAPHVDININLNGSVTNKNEVGGDNANAVTEKSGVVAQTQSEADAFAEAKVQPNNQQTTPLEMQFLKYKSKAENGDPKAQYNLGKCYATGQGVDKNDVEAVKWFRKSAEQGNAIGQNALGAYYAAGQGVDKNDVEAVKWFRKAAEQGFVEGQYNLGLCYAIGQGIDKNYMEAGKWLRKAAEQGHLEAKEQEAAVKELVQAEAIEQDEAKQRAEYEKQRAELAVAQAQAKAKQRAEYEKKQAALAAQAQAEAKQRADAEEAFAKQKAQEDARERLLNKLVLAACGVLLFTPIVLTYFSLRKK
jgi:TPR repeat protein